MKKYYTLVKNRRQKGSWNWKPGSACSKVCFLSVRWAFFRHGLHPSFVIKAVSCCESNAPQVLLVLNNQLFLHPVLIGSHSVACFHFGSPACSNNH